MRKIVVILLLGALGSIVLLTFLYLRSSSNPNEHFKGFNRIFSPMHIIKLDSVGMPLPQFRLAGIDSHYVYIANVTNQRDWLRISKNNLTDTTRLRFTLPHVEFRSIQYDANENGLFVADGTKPFVMQALPGQTAFKKLRQREYFVSMLPLAGGSKILLSRVKQELCLLKQSAGTDSVRIFSNLLQRQRDGFFSMYGRLHADVKDDLLIYLYLNRNQFITIDTNMNLLYRASTIDTIRWAKIKVGKTDSNTSTLASPPMPVNLHSCVADGKLYVHSNIMAANEKAEVFERNVVIDVYDLSQKGKYRYSFYLPNMLKKPFKEFKVTENKVFAVFGDVLVRWQIS